MKKKRKRQVEKNKKRTSRNGNQILQKTTGDGKIYTGGFEDEGIHG